MSLLPSYAQTASTTTSSTSSKRFLKEWEVDWETNELTGNLVTGNTAVKAWIYKALKTVRKRYPVYTWNYGSDLESFIGQTLSAEYLKTDLRLAFEECLYINSDITGIEDFEVETDGDLLSISCTVTTIYGPVSILDYDLTSTSTRLTQITNQVITSINAGSTVFYIQNGSLYFRSIDVAESVLTFSLSDGDLIEEASTTFDAKVTIEINREIGAAEATY